MEAEQADRAIQRAAERLYEDERLRSNMSDSEASIVLTWAAQWIQERLKASITDKSVSVNVQDETARVRQAITSFNELAKKPGNLRVADAIAVLESPIQAQSLNRDQIFRLLTEMTTAIWTMRAESSQPKPMAVDPNLKVPTEE